jgi:hypothetical protein
MFKNNTASPLMDDYWKTRKNELMAEKMETVKCMRYYFEELLNNNSYLFLTDIKFNVNTLPDIKTAIDILDNNKEKYEVFDIEHAKSLKSTIDLLKYIVNKSEDYKLIKKTGGNYCIIVKTE